MDLNPKHFEKPKDSLFFDFFSIYTKNYIKKPTDELYMVTFTNKLFKMLI